MGLSGSLTSTHTGWEPATTTYSWKENTTPLEQDLGPVSLASKDHLLGQQTLAGTASDLRGGGTSTPNRDLVGALVGRGSLLSISLDLGLVTSQYLIYRGLVEGDKVGVKYCTWMLLFLVFHEL